MRLGLRLISIVALLVGLLAYAFSPVKRRFTVLGLWRQPSASRQYLDVVSIPDTVHCEDLHYLPGVNELFTACEDNHASRFSWFPPLANFDDATVSMQGSLHVIDLTVGNVLSNELIKGRQMLTTFKPRRLLFKNFSGPFVTHGIDVIRDPDTPDAFFIYAVNHLPHPDFEGSPKILPRARSQIEIFHYFQGSDSVEHLRTVRHPLIKTPNDIYAADPKSFYVTNDHYYRGGVSRLLEDVVSAAKWSTLVHVQLHELSSDDPESGITASVALSGIHNSNGMGHVRNSQGEDQDEILITSASSGTLHRTFRADASNSHDLIVVEELAMDSTLDNPSYYADPYPEVQGDASGYILCGLTRGLEFSEQIKQADAKDALLVWHVTKTDDGWAKRVIFEDDGSRIRAATTAVLVPIDPEVEEGAKRGWLFIASLFGESIIAVKVDI